MRAQAQQVYANIGQVLQAAGATPAQIVRIDTYYTDLDHRTDILEVRDAFFQGNRPCSVAVVVKSLASPDWLIEVQGIAVLD